MALEFVWFLLIAVLLAAYAVLDGFDLGIGALYPFLARNKGERVSLRGAVGPFWDGNEVWLLTAGGALFAAFPPVYAMTFSGFYLAIMLALFALIVRAVSLEFRHRDDGHASLWDALFFLGSLVPALLFGVALGNVIRGVPMNAEGDYIGSFWGLLNPFSLLVGLTGLAMFVAHGAAWAALKTEGLLRIRSAIAQSRTHWVLIGLIALTTLYAAFTLPDRVRNVLDDPLGWLLLAALLASLVATRVALSRGRELLSFLGSGITIVSLIGIAAAGNYPEIVPARGSAPDTALTVGGTASSHLTLTVMLIVVCIGLPIVLAYTAYVYRTFRGRVHPASVDY